MLLWDLLFMLWKRICHSEFLCILYFVREYGCDVCDVNCIIVLSGAELKVLSHCMEKALYQRHVDVIYMYHCWFIAVSELTRSKLLSTSTCFPLFTAKKRVPVMYQLFLLSSFSCIVSSLNGTLVFIFCTGAPWPIWFLNGFGALQILFNHYEILYSWAFTFIYLIMCNHLIVAHLYSYIDVSGFTVYLNLCKLYLPLLSIYWYFYFYLKFKLKFWLQ